MLVEEKVAMTKDILDSLTFDLYIFKQKESDADNQAIKAYSKGIIFSSKRIIEK